MNRSVEEFVNNVRKFCQWAESSQHEVQTARELLLALMQGVSYLPADYTEESETEYPERSREDWKADYKRFADFPFQYYWKIFSPCNLDEETPVTGDVHDDLADIYEDLWHGLQALDLGDATYARNYWYESYFIHWGHHASSAVYAVDEYFRKEYFRKLVEGE
ncbi:DUF5063 domain-containing protein [Pedosphaera parvula]|uniref:DUF5063 domain-containing protein n=1 Tax=Pedosphaera parvula (strain Ellin514) TaxID=320771 RepID=B9XBE5_PEDPL|nr:DUF5063 domain-containing protein [Pedosphaera parvula]EEF62830.1 conserved hypothetical protein [Pedosphaera parvula Ellin514]